jgi:hypothetical protein
LQGDSHPDDSALFLHSDLVRLHLSQIARLLYQMLMHLLTMFPSTLLPIEDCAFVHLKGSHNSLNWTSVGQQCEDDNDDFLGSPQPIEDRPFGLCKSLAAHMAFVASLFEAMYTDVACAYLASCRTGGIRAKYGLWWVHWFTLLVDLVSQTRLCQWTPFCSSSAPTTV